jgi:hypothetical protein
MSYKIARALRASAAALALLALAACESGLHDFSKPPESPAKLAAMRSRVFATGDKPKALRAAIAALQELGFVIDRADFAAGSVSGAKADDYLLRWTVTAASAGAGRLLVRAVLRYDVTTVLEPEPYEKIFAILARHLALDALPAN